jgi:hypothetical protein
MVYLVYEVCLFIGGIITHFIENVYKSFYIEKSFDYDTGYLFT